MRRYCFITGFLRSGTTLVEKMVHALPGACIGPQPFPYLYYDVKRAFLRTRGVAEEPYPLGHLFREQRYRHEDFEAFLDRYHLSPAMVAGSFAAMRGYGGWQLPALADRAVGVCEGSFAEVYRQLCDRVADIVGRSTAADLVGAKEVFCEEFIPYFLREGLAVILVLRDVRDVLTSLKGGAGSTYGNRRLPLLHIVRQWRKSVAFALQFSGTPGFELMRYEELVARPERSLEQLASRLDRPAAQPGALEDLRDQQGRSWESNSSFTPARGISRDAIGRFAAHLPPAWLAVVEFLCAPEMARLRMTPAAPRIATEEFIEALQRMSHETQVVAPGNLLGEEIQAELSRIRLIAARDASEAEQRHWFIYPRAYCELAALNG